MIDFNKSIKSSSIDWITGERFLCLSDFVYSLNNKKDCNKYRNTFSLDALFTNAIIYTNTMYVNDLFKELKRSTCKNITVISHNSDDNVSSIKENIPNCVSHWYAMNVDKIDSKIYPLPIGLENNKWFMYVGKKGIMRKVLEETKKSTNLVYCNFDIKTNPIERKHCWDYFQSKCSCWVTMEQYKNGVKFENYIHQIYNHPFVICPEGNGLDTVRVWETLYMGSIPIVKDRLHWQILSKILPIFIVHHWEEINEKYLNNVYREQIKGKKWNMDALQFSFWKKLIKNKSK